MDQDVFQNCPNRVGDAVMAGDYASYAPAVSLLFTLVTETSTLMVGIVVDLRQGFEAYHKMLLSQKVTQMMRTSSGLVGMGEGLIVGNYTTHLLVNDQPIVEPFESSMNLRNEGGTWKATAVVNSTSNNNWPMELPQPNKANNAA